MFWIFRRTGENLFNAINNSYSIKGKNTKIGCTDVERNRPERRAYSKLNQNSDDLNFGTKNDLLITNVENEKSRELKLKISKFVNKSDNNGNEMEYLQRKHVAINIATDSILDVEDEYSNSKNSIDPMTISDDDDDYDESHFCSVCDRSFITKQILRNHQQKKRHFGCGGCDTLFGDIVHLDHHKDEYEHWSEGDDAHLPCCQRNRRIEFEFSDSDSDSEAQSEDLERLI